MARVHAVDTKEVVVHPKQYIGPLRNPMIGFIGGANGRHQYATLAREYVKWNAIENSSSDGVDKLRAYANAHWKGVENRNIKVIPRVFLEWPKGSGVTEYWPIDSYWPADLPRDFGSAQFKRRAARMIEKMGDAWDNDPRVAFVEMGIVGPWGEQHHPSLDPETEKILGDAFEKAFKHKLVMNRYPWNFKNYKFGIHWDSFGNPGWEMRQHVPEFEGQLEDRWKIAPMSGEMAFSIDPRMNKPRLAMNPTDAVAAHADTLIQYIRRWHWTALGWVSNYDPANPVASRGAARIQEAFGYRFVIDEARFPARVKPGESISVSFSVSNLGSTPIYYNWPVEISLLNKTTREPVWKAVFPNVDIRSWLPGDFSDKGKGRLAGDKEHTGFVWDTGLEYDIPAKRNVVRGTFTVSRRLPAAKYILALAIVDPAGELPGVKFAIENYFNGGRHPLGYMQVGMNAGFAESKLESFDDPGKDNSLHYVVGSP